MTQLASDTSPATAGLDSGHALRAALMVAGDEQCTAGVVSASLRPIVYSRHHWLLYKGEYRVRADLKGILESIGARPPNEWDDDESDFVLSLLALDAASVGLDDLTDRVSSSAVREVLHARHALYASVLEPSDAATPVSLLDLARSVAAKRLQVQESYELYSDIDGGAWFRSEGLILRDDIDTENLTSAAEEKLASTFDLPSGDVTARLRTATRQAVRTEGDSASVVRALMAATLVDPVLRGDHVTLTCPQGNMLDRPHEMTTSEAFFTETQLRDGVDLGDYAERLGHESEERLERTIKARMLKLKRGAIRNLHGSGCLQGMFIDKHGRHMIYRNEDTHYRGHQSVGVSTGGRASFSLRYSVGGGSETLTPMVGDLRVVRMTHAESELFNSDELKHLLRYGEWFRVVIEETYRMGAVVRTDKPVI